MTIPTTIAASGPYTPNGATTVFPFGFKALSDTDVQVVLVAPDGTETILSSAAYNVTLAAGDDPGGSVTMLSAPVNDGRKLWIYLDPTFLQEIKFEDEGAFNQTILNQLADEAGARAVWLRDKINRAVQLPAGEVAPALPGAGSRAGKFLGFDPLTGALGVFAGTGSAGDAAQVTYTPSGLGGKRRLLTEYLGERKSVKDFGAIGDGVLHTAAEWIIPGVLGRYASLAALQVDYPHVTATTDPIDWAAFQAGVNYFINSGSGTLEVTDGAYNLGGKSVVQSRGVNKNLGICNIEGTGRQTVTIVSNGGVACFSATGYGQPDGMQTLDLRIGGMTILGNGVPVTGSVAIGFTLVSDPHFEDLHIEGFEYAFYFQDVDQAVFDACMIQFNTRGLFARQNPAGPGVVPNCTQPNQYVFNGTTWLNNSLSGLHCVGGSNWTFNGGVISTCGIGDNVNGFGIKFEDCGYQGGTIVTMTGVNFEANNGVADVILDNDLASGALTQSSYVFIGCSFNRTSNTYKATNSIITNFGSIATVGDQVLVLIGNVFKSLGSYTPNAGRPYLATSGVQGFTHKNLITIGNIFEDAVEAPTKIQSYGKPFSEVAKTGNQVINNATATVWQLDTSFFSYIGVGTINGSFQVVIAESGNYLLDAVLTWQLAVAGTGVFEIRRNGTVILRSQPVGTDVWNVCGAKYLAAGDLIDVRVTQNSGGAATIAGASFAASYLNIQKMADG